MQLTRDEFHNCSNYLFNQIMHAQESYQMFWGFNEEFSRDRVLWNQTGEIWDATRMSHFNSTLSELTRIYDTNGDSFNIHSWIESGAHSAQNLPHKPYIDQTILQADLKLVSPKDALVNKLTQRRNHCVAHANFKLIREKANFTTRFPLTFGECKTLIARAFDFFNKYHSIFYEGSTGAVESYPPIGDIRQIFVALKEHFERNIGVKSRSKSQ